MNNGSGCKHGNKHGSKHGNSGSMQNSSKHDLKSDYPVSQKLQRTCRIHEHTISSLTSKVTNLRLVMLTETAKHEVEMESMKAEADLSASKVEISEEQFVELNKMQEEMIYGNVSEIGSGTKQSIVSLDAGYVSGLTSDLEKQKKYL